jgi:DNA-binding PucR family transcriptional regulator
VAAEAEWPLPRALAVLAIAGPGREAAAARLPPDTIAETIGELVVAVVPDADGPGRQAQLERAVRDAGAHAGLGITVGWPQAAGSFARAQAALRLADGDAGLVAASERAGELLLRADPALAQELARDRLAALDELSPGARARLTATLSAWLAEQGRLGAVAARLEIHPQTARYRLSRLRELFGDRLDDPDERFWLELALRVSSD